MLAGLKQKWYSLMHNEALKQKLYVIIFENDTPLGKLFDIVLIWSIVLSILLVIAESMQGLPHFLDISMVWLEYILTAIFTFEYLTRLYCSPKPKEYALSVFGIIDLLATLPVYIGAFFGPARYLMIIRTFRLIRVFRVFKLFSFLEEGDLLMQSIIQSARKIFVFFLFVLILVISLGTIMYMVEGHIEGSEFTDIPRSIYWAIVTLTTVGYGDITPATRMGQFLSAIVMMLGYTIMAVPTGIVSAQMIRDAHKYNTKVSDDQEILDDEIPEEEEQPMEEEEISTRFCPYCGRPTHDSDALFCKYCGERL